MKVRNIIAIAMFAVMSLSVSAQTQPASTEVAGTATVGITADSPDLAAKRVAAQKWLDKEKFTVEYVNTAGVGRVKGIPTSSPRLHEAFPKKKGFQFNGMSDTCLKDVLVSYQADASTGDLVLAFSFKDTSMEKMSGCVDFEYRFNPVTLQGVMQRENRKNVSSAVKLRLVE